MYLVGRDFVIQTDHRALQWLNSLKESNSRLTRSDSSSIFILSPTSARNDQLKCRHPLKDSNNMKLLKLRRKECDGAELTLICIVELII